MLPALQGGPPSGTKRDDETGCRDKACQDGGASGLVGGFARGCECFVDALLCFRLRHASPLSYHLGKVCAVRGGQRTVHHRTRNYAGHLRP